MSNSSVDIAYGRGHLKVRLQQDVAPTIIRKVVLPKLADQQGAIAAGAGVARRCRAAGATRQGAQERLHPDLRHHPAGAQQALPAADDRDLMAAGMPADAASPSWWRPGCTAPTRAPNSPKLVGDPWVHENVRVENHFAATTPTTSISASPDARHAGQDRPALRRGRPAHRVRTGRAALHGRLVGRPQGGRARRRAPRDHPHLPFGALHGGPAGDPVQPRRNPLHEEQLEIVRKIGEIYAINTVIDEDRDLIYVNFGEVIASHLAASTSSSTRR
jgi:hypothetical protein